MRIKPEILLFAAAWLTLFGLASSIKCYLYEGTKTDTSNEVDCPLVKKCARMHGTIDGSFKVAGLCGENCLVSSFKEHVSVTCALCDKDKCNSASGPSLLTATSALGAAFSILLCLKKFHF